MRDRGSRSRVGLRPLRALPSGCRGLARLSLVEGALLRHCVEIVRGVAFRDVARGSPDAELAAAGCDERDFVAALDRLLRKLPSYAELGVEAAPDV